jgi:hypothetical protein
MGGGHVAGERMRLAATTVQKTDGSENSRGVPDGCLIRERAAERRGVFTRFPILSHSFPSRCCVAAATRGKAKQDARRDGAQGQRGFFLVAFCIILHYGAAIRCDDLWRRRGRRAAGLSAVCVLVRLCAPLCAFVRLCAFLCALFVRGGETRGVAMRERHDLVCRLYRTEVAGQSDTASSAGSARELRARVVGQISRRMRGAPWGRFAVSDPAIATVFPGESVGGL